MVYAEWCCGRGFIEHFFQCTDCSEHFLQLLGDKAATAVQSREDAMLWMWRSHNAVRSMPTYHIGSGWCL